MIQIGKIVDATVSKVETYGIFLEYDGQEIFVDIINISWKGKISTREYTKKGDILSVLVTNQYGLNKFNGSIRDIYPSENPWNNPAIYGIGSKWNGLVKSKTNFGYFIELNTGAEGLLQTHDPVELALGQEISVIISGINVESQKISFNLA